MNDREEARDFLREEVYRPSRAQCWARRPEHRAPGTKYKITREEDACRKRWYAANCLTESFIAYVYYVEDDLGRVISVPACFFEHDTTKPLLHESGEGEFTLYEDRFNVRAEFEIRGLKYTKNVTYYDFGIDPTRMSPDEATAAWNQILNCAGVVRRTSKNDFTQMGFKVSQIMHAAKDLQKQLSDAEKAALSDK